MSRMMHILRESFRVVKENRLRAFIMMLGMAVGVASLSLTMSVSRGAYVEVMAIVNEQGADLLQIRPGTDRHTGPAAGSPEAVSLVEDDFAVIVERVGNIRAAAPVRDRRDVDVTYGDQFTLTRVFGVIPIWAEIRDFGAVRGEFITDDDVASSSRVVLIGQTVKRNLFGDVDPIGETIRIGDVAFVVKGELEPKGISAEGRDRDDRMVIPFSTFYMRLFRDIPLTQIVITIADLDRMDETVGDVRSVLREQHGLGPDEPDDFAMRTPEDLINVAYETRQSLINILTGITVVSLLVAGIVIMNIMLASVSARKREIGMRRAVGARKADILGQFLVEGLVVALVGGVVGALLGFGGATVLAALDVAASRITIQALLVSLVACTVIAVVFGMFPAKRAADQHPVDALRV
jgi:putative ABC transport system permease protein